MNGHERLRTHMGALISHGFAFGAVRETLGLKGASEVWSGPETDDQPAWYLWLDSMQGAYRLRLMQSGHLDDDPASAVRGVFSVKYYPSPGEPVFKHFSEQEQALIEGPWFDETRTPTFDAQERVPEILFNVGTIELIEDVSSGQSFLQYSSLDRLRHHAGSVRPDEHAGVIDTPTPAAKPKVRQVPAWDLGYPLFDAIVGLQAFFARTAPKRIILSRQRGFEFIDGAAGCRELRDTDAVALRSLLVAFFPANGFPANGFPAGDGSPSPVEDSVTAGIRAEPWLPVLDTAAGWACKHTASESVKRGVGAIDRAPSLRSVAVGPMVWEIPLAFNEQWWVLSAAEWSANTMPCGCH